MGAVEVDLRGVCAHDVPDVLRGIADHYGLSVEVLAKSERDTGEWPDPRSPRLTRLVELARRSWSEWGDRLVDELVELANSGKLFPLSRDNEAALVELLADHEAALTVRLTGRAPGMMLERLVRRGLITPSTSQEALIPVAFRLGRVLDVMQALPERPESREDLASIVRDALAVKLTPEDEGALDYIQQRGFSLVRRPAGAATANVLNAAVNHNRLLTTDELGAFRAAADRAVRERASRGRWRELLVEAVHGNESLQNDLDRIARTEGMFAHGYGAYRSLRERVGPADVDVFRYTSPKACRECRRIWGPPDAPRVYKLSVVEAWERAGGNFQKPAKEWGPTIGPVHPNCACSPIMRYSKAVALADERARAILGR